MSRHKREVFDELINEVRASQNATDRFDQAVADALGLNRTDMRCMDVLHRSDRRRVLVELTSQAQIDAGRFYGEHAAASERVYQRYSVKELELLLGFVREGREFNENHAARVEQQNRARGVK